MKSGDLKRKSGMVRVLGGFSEQQNIKKHHPILQVDDFDDGSRIQISNELYKLLGIVFGNRAGYFFGPNFSYNLTDILCKDMLNDVFCERNAIAPGYQYDWQKMFEKIHDTIMQATYNEVFDLIQYVCLWVESRLFREKGEMFKSLNAIFQKENIGYRFVAGRITPITDNQEMSSIEEACRSPIEGCRKQIQKAVAFLSDRQNPDYKNCIKESISAVESICQVIVGDEKATLGDALKQLEKSGLSIHPCLKTAFSKLYGYTTDQGGIRHAEGMFESNVTFEEAKFMLVSCSAFINYLIAEYGKRGN